ncbi:MAG TPA: PAS domain S-box protein [Pyrinomonadaceae bacterium]|jgi:PAS domain S-box-containing protein
MARRSKGFEEENNDGSSEGEPHETEKLFELLLESATDYAIFAMDPQRCVRFWNKGAERILGYTEEEIVGHSGDIIFTPEDIAAGAPDSEMETALGDGRAEDDRWHVRRDGSRFFATGVMTPLVNGHLQGFVKILRDHTEKKLTEDLLRESEERLRTVIESVHDYAIFTLDPEGRVTSWNEGARRLKGYIAAEIIGEYVGVFYTPEDAGKPEREMRTALRTGRSEDESWRVRKDGTLFWVNEIMTPLRDENGRLQGFTKVSRDLTERRRAEETLRENEQMLRHLARNIPGGSLNVFDRELRYIFADGQGLAQVGLDSAQIVGKKLSDIFSPEAVRFVEPYYRRAFDGEDVNFEMDVAGRWFLMSAAPLEDSVGGINAIIVLAQDITEHKRAEKALRDKEMLQKLVHAQEDERRRVARELDDQLGQKLTALRLKLESLDRSGERSLRVQIAEIQTLAKRIDDGVDYLAWDLRPASLDDLGLYAALDKFIREWSEFTKIEAQLLVSGTKKQRFSPETEINLYRIAQEALSNVYKHSGAGSVEVMLAIRDSSVTLIVEDDGKGLRAGDSIEKSETRGLMIMKERAALIGGQLEIETNLGQGTTIFVKVPFSADGQ